MLLPTNMLREFRFAARALGRGRLGTVVAVLTVAIAIGASTALLALLQAVLTGFPGVPEHDRVARVYAASRSLGVERGPVTLNEFDTTLTQASSFGAMGAYTQDDVLLTDQPDPARLVAGYATPDFFQVLAVPPLAGRVFTSSDVVSGAPVVVLSEALWRRTFPDGRLDAAVMSIDGVRRTVIGVMPREFSYALLGISADVWIPFTSASRQTPAIVTVFARLRSGVGWPAADAQLAGLRRGRSQWAWRALPIDTDAQQRAMTAVLLIEGPALLILSIGCVNVACLLMARSSEREQEIGVRRALGATRASIVRQMLTEHLLLAAAGGVLGTAAAFTIVHALAAALAGVQPQLADRLAIGAGVLPAAVASTLLACALFGMLPALRLSRLDVVSSLNGAPACRRVRLAGYGARDLIVFLELGCAAGLILFAAMFFNLFGQILRITPRFPADSLVAVRVPGRDAPAVAERIARVPGVVRVARSNALFGDTGRAGQVRRAGGRPLRVAVVPVGDGFFETVGLPMLRGRGFDEAELKARPPVLLLSETAARLAAPGQDPIGLTLRLDYHGQSLATVVGVVADAMDDGSLIRAGVVPADVYVPYDPAGADTIVLARAATGADALVQPIAAAARTIGQVRPPRASTMAQRARFDDPGSLLLARTLAGLALIALLLAASGIFANVGQSVAQRRTEFGVRMALGAPPRRVLRMVLARETKLIAAALLAGAGVTVMITRAAFGELVTLSASAPMMWTAVAMLCGGVAGLACAMATARILTLAPAAVLRRS
ncbi:MAG TPA: ABC transporter permease [Vicinamibacterales bacterium]|nr:ABC transporter permease [Vicinamibacterales bacterium]